MVGEHFIYCLSTQNMFRSSRKPLIIFKNFLFFIWGRGLALSERTSCFTDQLEGNGINYFNLFLHWQSGLSRPRSLTNGYNDTCWHGLHHYFPSWRRRNSKISTFQRVFLSIASTLSLSFSRSFFNLKSPVGKFVFFTARWQAQKSAVFHEVVTKLPLASATVSSRYKINFISLQTWTRWWTGAFQDRLKI